MQQIRYNCNNCTYYRKQFLCNYCEYWNKIMYFPNSCIREVTILDPEYDYYFELVWEQEHGDDK